MKVSKKFISVMLILCLVLSFALAGCGETKSDEVVISEPINVAVMNGPTGMGMVDLMDSENYNIEVFQSPSDALPKIISGEVDVACLPSNMAAVLYNKTGGDVVCVTPMVMGMLQILGNNVELNSIQDLKGKTIVSSGQGGTPEYALQKVLEANELTLGEDVKVEWLASHSDVNAKLLAEEGTIAMMPEPFVSVALAQGSNVKSLFDMNTLWEGATGEDFPMGVLVARRSFVDERNADLQGMLTELKASIEDVNSLSDEVLQKIVDNGFLSDVDVAKAAIPNCNLCLYTDLEGDYSYAQGTEIMTVFNNTMFETNAESVGGTLPGSDLYYAPPEG